MVSIMSNCLAVASAAMGVAGLGAKKPAVTDEETCDEMTPTTTASECGDATGAYGEDTETDGEEEPQLGPGLFPSAGDDLYDDAARGPPSPSTTAAVAANSPPSAGTDEAEEGDDRCFSPQETLFVFDWDDTVLPSSWMQRQGLRLDSRSVVQRWQRETLQEVAASAAEMLCAAKQRGTVVLLTNAERGWIELSCQKFLPTLLPAIEGIKIVSARTSYDGPRCATPLDWKVAAFEAEIARACGAETLVDPLARKNIHSLGDSSYEREALMRATAALPNCLSKSIKFVERPDPSQLLKQHALVTTSLEKIVQHKGPLDMFINC